MRSLIRSLLILGLSVCAGHLAGPGRPLLASAWVTLSWNRNLEEDISGYRVYYGVVPGEYEFVEDADADTFYTVTGLEEMTYYFAVTAYDEAGNESDYSEEVSWTPGGPTGVTGDPGPPGAPRSYRLSQNFPNPFNPSTAIHYSIAPPEEAGVVHASLTVYSLRGRIVRTLVDEEKAPGDYVAFWNGEDDHGERMASGTYLYHLRAGDFSSTRKMVLAK